MTETKDPEKAGRPFIGIHFKCCNIYQRIYLNKTGDAFVGWCPRCAAKTVVKIAPGGSKSRFYSAD